MSETTGWIVPSSISSSSGVTHGSSVPRSFQSVSMFRPMIDLEASICSIRLKPRSIGSACGAAFSRLRLCPGITDDAPNATSRPPARSIA